MSVGTGFGKSTPKAVDDKIFEQKTKEFLEYTGLTKAYNARCNDMPLLKVLPHIYDVPTMVGIEIEVEGMHKPPPNPPLWDQKIDNSLRNHGLEFTSQPVTPKQTVTALLSIWTSLYKLSKPDFSWRTSIHFHLDVCKLDNDEMRKMMLLSLLFEDLFFKLVGSERETSIFCVPLRQSSQMSLIRSFIQKKKSLGDICGAKWHKYSAVNLSRVPDLGTVEFRHLGGTDDLNKVLIWLSVLLQIYRASISLTMTSIQNKIMELKSSEKYMDFVNQIFTPEVASQLQIKNWPILFEDTISKAKDFFVEPVKFDMVKENSLVAKYSAKVLAQYEGKTSKVKETVTATEAAIKKAAVKKKLVEDFEF